MLINNEVIQSWLKHIKHCEFTQQSYTLSPNWYVSSTDTKPIIEYFNKTLSTQYKFDDIYDYAIDLLAHNIKDDMMYFCITTINDYRIVYIKVLHSIIVSLSLFKKKNSTIIIAVPIINEAIKARIQAFVNELNKFIKSNSLDFGIMLYFDNEYNSQILSSLITNVEYARDDERFLQSLILINNFNKIQTKVSNAIITDDTISDVDIKKEIGLINKEFFINNFETFISYKRGNIDKDILQNSVNKNLSYDRFGMIERIFEYELEVSILNFILENSPELESKNPDILLKAKKLIHKYR